MVALQEQCKISKTRRCILPRYTRLFHVIHQLVSAVLQCLSISFYQLRHSDEQPIVAGLSIFLSLYSRSGSTVASYESCLSSMLLKLLNYSHHHQSFLVQLKVWFLRHQAIPACTISLVHHLVIRIPRSGHPPVSTWKKLLMSQCLINNTWIRWELKHQTVPLLGEIILMIFRGGSVAPFRGKPLRETSVLNKNPSTHNPLSRIAPFSHIIGFSDSTRVWQVVAFKVLRKIIDF